MKTFCTEGLDTLYNEFPSTYELKRCLSQGVATANLATTKVFTISYKTSMESTVLKFGGRERMIRKAIDEVDKSICR